MNIILNMMVSTAQSIISNKLSIRRGLTARGGEI